MARSDRATKPSEPGWARAVVRRRRAVEIPAALLALVSVTTAGVADVRVCNRSSTNMNVSIGYYDPKFGWTSVGWWSVAAGRCQTVFDGRPSDPLFYTYADGENGDHWQGDDTQKGGGFCISPTKYVDHARNHIARRSSAAAEPGRQVIDCEASGLQTRRFLEDDTKGVSDFTVSLTSDPRPVPGAPPVASSPPALPPAPPAPPGQAPGSAGNACQRYPNLC